jgi:uncharacterized membrane protein
VLDTTAAVRYAIGMSDAAADQPMDTMFHRAVGGHAPPFRRILIVAAVGTATALVLLLVIEWELALLIGWDVAAITFLTFVVPVIGGSDGTLTAYFARRVDDSRRTAGALVVVACLASLLSVLVTLAAAGRESGGHRLMLIAGATVTVVVSWTVVNTIFTLRYADLYYSAGAGSGAGDAAVDFGSTGAGDLPDYRDFAYLAFTIGMCYQVSDTTLRDRRVRRTVLGHAVLSYVFGVVIVAAGINLVAGLIQ